MRFVEPAPAKLNLALHVRGRLPDGYHRLETLFAFAADGDLLEAEPADRWSLDIVGPLAGALPPPGGANLVLDAALGFAALAPRARPLALRLHKHLPVAAGLGGGSADAAAALRLLVRLHGPPPGLPRLAVGLGADVPACLAGGVLRGEGRGDALTPAGALRPWPLLLVNPGAALSTACVFAAWDGVDRGPLARGHPLAVALGGRNDLEPAARLVSPAAAAAQDFVRALPGALLARMSGSGATAFALFQHGAAARAAAARVPAGWWSLLSRIDPVQRS